MTSAATGPLIRSLPIPKCCITAVPTLSKPTKFSSFSASFPSRVSLKHKISSSSGVVSFVAQISEWAQEEEKEEHQTVDGFKWEDEEDEGDGIGDVEEGEDFIAEPNEDAKLFVGGLPFAIDSEDLAELFDQAGVVASAEVIYDRETDKSRGFGYVTMSTVEEAQKAAKMFNRYELDGWLLNVNKVPSASDRSFRIYVGNLALEMDDSRLEQVFSEHGKVMHARVFFHRQTGRSRGFGFVTMSSETEMNDAIAALDGQTLDGKSIRVKVAVDQPRRGSF